MNATTWIVQYLGEASETRKAFLRACEAVNRPIVEVKIVPFSEQMPELPDIAPPFVFYGYATLLSLAFQSLQWRSGVFFDPELFRPEEYLRRYGKHMLNGDLKITTFSQLEAMDIPVEKPLFIRPNDDYKDFTGQVMTFGEFRAWVENFQETGERLTRRSLVAYCAPKLIEAEWRLFLLEGEIIGASQYQPVIRPLTPPEVSQFGRETARIWSPVPAYVMDVALADGELKVIELNCFNGSGFYRADMESIVGSLSRYLEAHCP